MKESSLTNSKKPILRSRPVHHHKQLCLKIHIPPFLCVSICINKHILHSPPSFTHTHIYIWSHNCQRLNGGNPTPVYHTTQTLNPTPMKKPGTRKKLQARDWSSMTFSKLVDKSNTLFFGPKTQHHMWNISERSAITFSTTIPDYWADLGDVTLQVSDASLEHLLLKAWQVTDRQNLLDTLRLRKQHIKAKRVAFSRPGHCHQSKGNEYTPQVR